jgi:hypothetical protein
MKTESIRSAGPVEPVKEKIKAYILHLPVKNLFFQVHEKVENLLSS